MGRLLGVAVALGIVAGGAFAAAPYDFSGHWTGTAPVLGLYGTRPWTLTSADQFRSAPPLLPASNREPAP